MTSARQANIRAATKSPKCPVLLRRHTLADSAKCSCRAARRLSILSAGAVVNSDPAPPLLVRRRVGSETKLREESTRRRLNCWRLSLTSPLRNGLDAATTGSAPNRHRARRSRPTTRLLRPRPPRDRKGQGPDDEIFRVPLDERRQHRRRERPLLEGLADGCWDPKTVVGDNISLDGRLRLPKWQQQPTPPPPRMRRHLPSDDVVGLPLAFDDNTEG